MRAGQRGLVFAAILGVAASGCTNREAGQKVTTAVSDRTQDYKRLAAKKVFFAHQSVGYNIVEGVTEILREQPAVGWQVIEAGEGAPGAMTAPAFLHALVGRNEQPLSKIASFAEQVRGGIGNTADVAFFKFCYLDITAGTDVESLFATYRKTMEELAREYPNTMFIHVTVPLKATTTGWKAAVKKILGRPSPAIADNLRRDEFNQLLRNEYGRKRQLFDLAAFEATRPDGSIAGDQQAGRLIPALAADYTNDNGHLNETGRRFVAGRLLSTLAAL